MYMYGGYPTYYVKLLYIEYLLSYLCLESMDYDKVEMLNINNLY